MTTPASDRFDDAMAAATRCAEARGVDAGAAEVLHRSNNVVVRFGDLVVKVAAHAELAERDVALAAHASGNGGPVRPPLGPLEAIDGFAVSTWPFVASTEAVSDERRADALVLLHPALADPPIPVRPLRSRFEDGLRLLRDHRATAAIDGDGRTLLLAALQRAVAVGDGDVVLHGEPHDGNVLLDDGRGVFIDLEGAVSGPLEWDLAFLPDRVIASRWPDADHEVLAQMRVAVSASISTACWRHVTARPDDRSMRGHAEHHLTLVRAAAD